MARASVRTMLPLDEYARIMGISPLHFNQVELPDIHPASTCSYPTLQYSWQNADKTGREELAEAIAEAETRISDLLGFKPVPQWEADERLVAIGPTLLGRPKWGYFIAGGQRAQVVIEAGAAVVYTDVMPTGDGYDETATITVSATVGTDTLTDTEAVAVFYPGEGGAEDWEIRPRHVVLSGGNIIITVRREQLVKPEFMEAFGARGVDGTDDANFLDEVDVYWRFHDVSVQAQLLWDGPTCGACEGNGCDACSVHLQTACLRALDYRNSLVRIAPATYDADTGLYNAAYLSSPRLPVQARLWYLAGWRNHGGGSGGSVGGVGGGTANEPNVNMDPKWARAIAQYATALLDRPLCSCHGLAAMSQHYREDLALHVGTNASSSSYRLGRIIDNPLGTQRGALNAWRLLKDEIVGTGVLVG